MILSGATSPCQAYDTLISSLEAMARETAIRQEIDIDALFSQMPFEHNPTQQYFTILASGLFDTNFYIAQNKDLQSLDIDHLAHYITHGDKEGRWPNPVFDPIGYRSQFQQGELSGVCTLYHYAVLGECLGLKTGGGFDPIKYLRAHPELDSHVSRPLMHYLHIGKPAGQSIIYRRRLSAEEFIEPARQAYEHATPHADLSQGANIIGPMDKISGLGLSARGYLDGLRAAGLDPLGCHTRQLEFPRQTSLIGADIPSPLPDAKVNIVHMNGDTFPLMMAHDGPELMFGKYNIGIWYWELPVLRPEWYGSLRYFNEFWAPTEYIARTIRAATAKPVRVLPPYLPGLSRPISAQPRHAGNYFIYCFDANSILSRKNPLALLKAFQQAFPSRHTENGEQVEDAHLVFKVTYPNMDIPEVSELYSAAAADLRIRIIDELLDEDALHDLVAGAVAYVSPHRSEGLGLTVIEAMASGVPVITTRHGGLSDFVDESTAFPVDFKLSEIEAEAFPYPAGYVWCDPDIHSMATQMTYVWNHRDEAEQRGEAARTRVLDILCSDSLIDAYRDAINQLPTP